MVKLNILILSFILCSCAASKIYIDSDPVGASIYKAKFQNGPWKRVYGDNSETPMSLNIANKKGYYLKAKKYGYFDSEIKDIQEIANSAKYQFKLENILKREFDSFYKKAILKIKIDESKAKNIAIMDFTSKGDISEEIRFYTTEFTQDALSKSNAFNIVDRRNVDKTLSELKLQFSGITDSEKALKIGKVLNVNEMVFGNIGYLNNSYIISFYIINVETSKIVYSDNTSFEKEEDLGEAIVTTMNKFLSKRFGLQ